MDTLIAVPSEQPGGLDAQVGQHFGHCEVYTLASVESGQIKEMSRLSRTCPTSRADAWHRSTIWRSKASRS